MSLYLKTQKQYQARTQPVFVPGIISAALLAAVVVVPSQLAKRGMPVQHQQAYFAPVKVIPNPAPIGIATTQSSDVFFKQRLIYQSKAEPIVIPVEIITVDKWAYPWSEPVRKKTGLAERLQQSAVGPVLDPDTQITQNYESRWHYPWSEPVRFKRITTAQQTSAYIDDNFTPEFFTADKWAYPWSEPVRQKPGLRTALHQSLIAPVLNPNTQITQNYESRWHYAWSEPIRTRQLATAQRQAFTSDSRTPETITADKWAYPWSEPVRLKPGLKAQLQDATVYLDQNPDFQDIESKWHYAWSEPVRFKRITTAQQVPAYIDDNFTPEFITTDKWIYPWSEPVRQKIGLSARLQQALIAPVLNPDTQITQDYESRWHYAWSEPVRFLRLATAHQQAFAFQPPSFEIITTDKWVYPWSEPVRQKPGLRAALQQTLIATTLDPDTQITQDYESRWHYAWSEPVRVKRLLPVTEQQAQVQGPAQTPEFITLDKWVYALSEPVRQKIGLKSSLQQALIAPVLNPDTQVTQDYESRWHYAWSEPVRLRRFPTAEQQAFAFQPPSFETITTDKWTYPWSEPVRQKAGLRASLQQALIATTLNPETQIIQDYESRWHYPWSEPVRFKRFITAQQSAAFWVFVPELVTSDKWGYAWSEPVRLRRLATAQQPFLVHSPFNEIVTGDKWSYAWSEPVRFRRLATAQQLATALPYVVTEFVTPDKWYEALSEPVRQLRGLPARLQQAAIQTVLNPNTQIIQGYESRWHYAWSEPVRFRRLPAAEQQAFTTDIQPPIIPWWRYGWSEPVRQKIGLKAHLQAFIAPQTPIFPNLTTLIQWFDPLAEPVRLKIGLGAGYQQFFQPSLFPLPNDVQLWLSATEVNTDSAQFSISTYNPVAVMVVSIAEIPFRDSAGVSIEET